MDRDTRIIFSLIILTVFLVVFIAPKPSTYPPTESTLSGEIEIGIISSTSDDYAKTEYLAGLAEDDLNKICNESGLNASFTFTIVSGEGSAATALSYVQSFHETGVDLIVGGGLSSQLWVMRDYVNTRGMVVVSPSSTNPQEPMIQDDALFRLTPHDFMIGKIMAHVAYDYGVEKILILERNDAWGIGIGDWFVKEYEELGGVVSGRVKYPPGTASDFSDYLIEAEDIIESDTNADDVGVFLLSFGETSEILNELGDYPYLLNAIWFSTDAVANSLGIDTVPENISASIKLISPLHLPVWDEYSTMIAREFHNRFGENFGFYEANIYDSCMVLGLSVIEADSKDASLVEEAISLVAEDYVGLTGPCGLDEYGDRLYFKTGLYAISYDPSLRWMIVGYYNSPMNEVIWEQMQ